MKILAFILSFFILFSAIIPCSVFDNCEEQEHAASSSQEEQHDCKGCSPFSICSATNGFTITNGTISLEPLAVYSATIYGELYVVSRQGYYSSLFQPPRYV